MISFRIPSELREARLVWALCAVASVYGWLVFATTFTRPGLIGLNYLAPGTDWMVFHTALRDALAGDFASVPDGFVLTRQLNTLFHAALSQDFGFRPWISPPGFLVILLPFCLCGFFASYLSFQLVTGAFLAVACRMQSVRRGWLIAALALLSPAASINVVSGQCAFLVGALFCGGFALLGRRPVLAGILLGLLTFKPQFFLLVPVALIALGAWRCLIVSLVSALALVMGGVVMAGPAASLGWAGTFLGHAPAPVLETLAQVSRWGDGVFPIALAGGVPVHAAMGLQCAATLVAGWFTWRAFRHGGAAGGLPVLLGAACLATPHAGDYDLILPVIAAGLWLSRGPGAPPFWRWIVWFCLWIAPLLSPPQVSLPGRVVPLLLLAFIAAATEDAAPWRPARGLTVRWRMGDGAARLG